MKLFLHTLTQVRIINEPLEWSGTPAAFLAIEPQYPGLPAGATVRYQTPDVQYYEDATGRHTDALNCLPYCDGAYLTTPGDEVTSGIYDHVNLLNKGTNTHAQLDTHVSDATKHFTQAQIDHVNLLSKGTNTHAQLDTGLAAAVAHASSAVYHVGMGAWVNLTLLNGWTQISGFRTAAYKVLGSDFLVFKGCISNLGSSSISPIFATLPIGRPGALMRFIAWGNGSEALITLNTTGDLACSTLGIAALSLENIVYSL